MGATSNDKVDLSGLCVLIAEDDFVAALSVAESVEAMGGEVLGPVAATAEGIALVRRTPPHIALLDMQLRDGFVTPLAAVLDQLDVPFGLVTGYRGEEFEKIVLSRAPRLPKPYRHADLIAMAAMLRQEVVGRRAYAIWEREGWPDGEADRHWAMAERELQAISRAIPRKSSNHLRPGEHIRL